MRIMKNSNISETFEFWLLELKQRSKLFRFSMVQKINLRNPHTQTTGYVSKGSTLALNLRVDVTRSPKQGRQCPRKRTDVLQFFLKMQQFSNVLVSHTRWFYPQALSAEENVQGCGVNFRSLNFSFVIITGHQQEQRAARWEDVDENPRLRSNRDPETHDHHRSDRTYVLVCPWNHAHWIYKGHEGQTQPYQG